MARFKPIDMSPKLIPVDFAHQILPGSFEYALCRLIDREIDLSELEARYRNGRWRVWRFIPSSRRH